MWTETFIPITLGFLAIIFLSVPVDGIILGSEKIMMKTKGLPNEFGVFITYLLTISLAYFIVQDVQFNFYAYLNVEFQSEWLQNLLNAVLVGCGTKALRQRFETISLIPMNISGLTSTMSNIIGRNKGGN